VSKTDDLINEALKNLGHEESDKQSKAKSADESEIVESENISDTDGKKREAVAKIDLQQFVDKEAYMRLAADFDNFRRRALKERKEWERQGKDKILRDLLDVIDNFSRGLSQAKDSEGPLATGMKMVLSQMEQILSSEGLEKIKTMGEKFDPAIHDAVARIESPGKQDGEIIEELKCGYKYSDRLLRPASVVVAKSDQDSEDSVLGEES